MITINEAEEILKKEYHSDNFEYLISNILIPDYHLDHHPVSVESKLFSSINYLGDSVQCEVSVFEVALNPGEQNRRVAITQEMFRILRLLRINNAIVAFVNDDISNYRISLLTSKYEFQGDKIVRVISNPRRYSYSLGVGTKTKTAYKFLIAKGQVNDLNDIISRFSVEVVNKQFYSEIATSFTTLVGGERDGVKYSPLLVVNPSISADKMAEFAVRLIGRIMFCWFLREKKSEAGISLVPDDMLSLNMVDNTDSYYHQVLEPLFFELLNTNQNRRKAEFKTECYQAVPYLNGGLFSPHIDDKYRYDSTRHCGSFDSILIPNEWFSKLYAVLNDYNFTVDENTAYDIELSIDPEMLGRIFENLLAEINPDTRENAKKSTGSFYTPRDVVDYMVDSSLCNYLKNTTNIDETKLKALISYSKEDDELAQFDKKEKKKIIDALYTVTVLDPACGSGAFPIGMLQKIVYILQELDPEANLWFDKATENVSIFIKKEFEKKFNSGSLNYIRKLSVIQNSIFGIDIQPIAVEISRLRCFLSLIIEEKVFDDEENRGINPLPNLDFKFIIADSLIELPVSGQSSYFEVLEHVEQLKLIREEFFNADSARRAELKLEFANVQQDMLINTINNYNKKASELYSQLSEWKPFANEKTDWFDSDWMFGIKDGFDIVIGNPPYVSTKGVDSSQKAVLKNQYGFADDLYYHFIIRGFDLLKDNGSITMITADTYFTTYTKLELRKKLLSYKLDELIHLGHDVFESAMVSTAIFIATKTSPSKEEKTRVLDVKGLKEISLAPIYSIDQSIYLSSINNALFVPNDINNLINDKFSKKHASLMQCYWGCISTSKGLSQNYLYLNDYRKTLVAGDITLLGLITEGGQGLATANNGKFVGLKKGSKEALRALVTRGEKLDAFNARFGTNYELPEDEFEIRKLFDDLKEKYGRDIFGQGYLYRIVDDSEIADVNKLTDEEKSDGIKEGNTFVPYDKGDKDGNRWYLITPYCIDWSYDNVQFLKKNSGKKGEGMPVVRNLKYYFKEGFCYSDIKTFYLRCRLKGKSIHDVKSMSFFPIESNVPAYYLISIINSKLIATIVYNFLNNTPSFQINDCRMLPIPIPTNEQLIEIKSLFDKAISVKKKQFYDEISLKEAEELLVPIQKQVDKYVCELYGFSSKETALLLSANDKT